jgi:hypothetical protein
MLVLRGGMHGNQAIERNATFGDRVADAVAAFGGSWVFIIFFGIALDTDPMLVCPAVLISQG